MINNFDDLKLAFEVNKPNGAVFPTRKVRLCEDPEYREIRGIESKELNQGTSLRYIYQSQSELPECLPEDIFTIKKETVSRILLYEKVFEQNTRHVIEALENIEGIYFIVSCGTAHLFGVAQALRERGIDVGFYITKNFTIMNQKWDIRSDTDAALYYAEEYRKLKVTVPLVHSSIATMIDAHRNDLSKTDGLDENAFVTIEELKKREITKIIVLSEDSLPEEGVIREKEGDLTNVLKQYQGEGFVVEVVGIDSRNRIHW